MPPQGIEPMTSKLFAKLFATCHPDDFFSHASSQTFNFVCYPSQQGDALPLEYYAKLVRSCVEAVLPDHALYPLNAYGSQSFPKSYRPSWVSTVERRCVLRCEEDGGGSLVAVISRLSRNFMWSYGDMVPYIFGLAIAGSRACLVVIRRVRVRFVRHRSRSLATSSHRWLTASRSCSRC